MIVLDYRDKRPIYEQVVEKMEHLIVCGGLEANSKLPSVRSLAMELSVNPNTIQRAYTQLEQDGYIYTILGRGNYVTSRNEWQTGKFEALRQDFMSLLQKARDAGMPLSDLSAIIHEVYAENEEDVTHD
ncbi:MAG: GntR family transcriptional regulator [Lachnospiraceae bacterium]|nr:GntR family transcriptional regulator [Lachnospiraceae bacterium]